MMRTRTYEFIAEVEDIAEYIDVYPRYEKWCLVEEITAGSRGKARAEFCNMHGLDFTYPMQSRVVPDRPTDPAE